MVTQDNVQRKYPLPPVHAKYISCRNAEAVVGQGYRWCRDLAYALGVPVIKQGKKRLIPAAEFFAAIEAQAAKEQQQAPAEQDPTAAVLAQLGLQVRK